MVGIAGEWASDEESFRAALGVGAISGILIGEGLYGLTFIAGTTFTPF